MTKTEIEDAVSAIIVAQFSIPRERVTPTTSLLADLGADSISLAEMVLRLEAELGIELPDLAHVSSLRVGDLVDQLTVHLTDRKTR